MGAKLLTNRSDSAQSNPRAGRLEPGSDLQQTLQRIRVAVHEVLPTARADPEQSVADLVVAYQQLEWRLASAQRDVQAADERFRRATSHSKTDV